MAVDIILIIVGLVATFVLAFASYDAKSRAVKVIFWVCLSATAGIIVISGIGSIGTSRDLRHVREEFSASTNKIHEIERKNRALEFDIVAVRDYSAVARLDALGNPPGAGIGSDIKVNTELTALLADTYSLKDNQIFMNRDADAEERYRTVVQKYPKFPFGHYYLALCLRDKVDQPWRQHAERAVEILTLTTQIDGHNTNHDEVLRRVSSWLENEKGTEPEN